MRYKFIRSLLFFHAPARHTLAFALLRYQRLVAAQEFLHLDYVIGERFSGRVHSRQAAADHRDRHADL
jgi:hypothetical protein